MQVIFAPDWRAGVPYQGLLAEALARHGVAVDFLTHYRRGLPLARGCAGRKCDWLHLHWPEAYYQGRGDIFDALRAARFPVDLALAARGRRLALTAHNLRAHNVGAAAAMERCAGAAYRRADVIFAHSAAAKEELVAEFALEPARVLVVPHGDLSVTLGPPLDRADARAQLRLDPRPCALMFGTVEPYKGIEAVIDFWRAEQPGAELHVVGKPWNAAYASALRAYAAEVAGVHLHLGWVDDPTLRRWLSAADAAVFNYRAIFTSGAATLARSYGLPLLIPSRLRTVDLAEPDPRVLRFTELNEDFGSQLVRALEQTRDFAAAAPWREKTSWNRVAELTAAAYRA